MRSPWPHFSVEELSCGQGECKYCSGQMRMNPDFMRKLGVLRRHFASPIIVTSGFRCDQRNKDEGGKPGSAHLLGRAVDISIKGRDAHRLLSFALSLGFTGVGISQKGAVRFIHLDDLEDGEAPRPWIWSY